MRKRLILMIWVVLTVLTQQSVLAGAIGITTVSPNSTPAGVPLVVKVTSLISDASVIPSSVNLQRLDASGRVVAVIGTLHDDGMNGDAVAGDNSYSISTTVFENTTGTVTLRVSAGFKGSLLRAYSVPLTIAITGTATGVTITSPTNTTYLNITPVTVRGVVGDPATVVSVNGVDAPVTGGNFVATVPLNEGPNTITAVAANSNGVISTASIQVTLDTTPPHVTVYSPTPNSVTADSYIAVTGLVNDIVVGTVNPQQARVTVNGVSAQVINRTFTVSGVPVGIGLNTFQVRAIDVAGNGVTQTVAVTRQALTETTLRVNSGNGQLGPIRSILPAPLVAQLLNEAGAPIPGATVIFRVLSQDGTLSVGDAPGAGVSSIAVNTDANGLAAVKLTLGSRAGAGNNIVEASTTGVPTTAVFTASATPAAAGLIVVDTGNHQFGVIGQPLPTPLVAIVTDMGYNRLAGVPVTFTVKNGGGSFDGKSSYLTTSDSDGRVLATLTVGPDQGVNNNVVEATFPNNAGFPAVFTATGLAPGPVNLTRISGVVLDNSNNPIEGVTMRLFQIHQGNAGNVPQELVPPVRTNAQGQFVIQPAPVGVFKLMADGGTAQRPGDWPTLEYDIVTVSGQNNTLGLPIYLPELNVNNRLCVSPTTGGTLTVPQAPGFSLTIAPGSATFPGGSRSGCVSVSPVNLDKVPMAPGFGQQPRFIVTIQPVGTKFDPPAAMTIPNVDGLPPRAVTEMYSYDHDLAAFVAIGTGTVSDDGSVIRSDPGVGVLKAGWHCGGNPNSSGSAGTCPECQKCQGSGCIADDSQVPAQNSPVDCKKEVCKGGSKISQANDTEQPPQKSPTDCKKEVCSGGSVTSQPDDTEKPTEICKECKNGKAENRPNGSTPSDPDKCCFDGQELPKYNNPYDVLIAKCPNREQAPDSIRLHDIDGCSSGLTSNIQDPMRGNYGASWLGQASTEFGRPQGLIPSAGAALNLPCNQHDICYQTCRQDKDVCDNAMRDRMRTVCAVAYPPTCPAHLTAEQCNGDNGYFEQRNKCSLDFFSYANEYWTGVQFGGGSAYRERQSQYCQCCS